MRLKITEVTWNVYYINVQSVLQRSSLVHAHLQTLVKGLNSPYDRLQRKIVADLLQCASKLPRYHIPDSLRNGEEGGRQNRCAWLDNNGDWPGQKTE